MEAGKAEKETPIGTAKLVSINSLCCFLKKLEYRSFSHLSRTLLSILARENPRRRPEAADDPPPPRRTIGSFRRRRLRRRPRRRGVCWWRRIGATYGGGGGDLTVEMGWRIG
ncbi:hypothetical protein LINPERPRIM_LOCUS19619 [Linum perenne]